MSRTSDASVRRWVGALATVACTGALVVALPLACGKGTEGGAPTDDGAPAPPKSDGSTSPGDEEVPKPVRDASTPVIDASVTDAAIPTGRTPPVCEPDGTFPTTLPIAEASAAAEVAVTDGKRELFVIGDSGHNGQGLFVDLTSRATRAFRLPLDTGANDDLEGIAWYKGALYTLTSSGAVRRFVPDGTGGFRRDQDAYRLGPTPASCADLQEVNCGRNYEGLCLREATSPTGCVGYAASKKEGRLYCLTMDASGRLAAAGDDRFVALDLRADMLSDCAFGHAEGPAAGALLVATNVYNASRSFLVDESNGKLSQMPSPFVLNLETVAADKDGALYVMSDDNSNGPSSTSRSTCRSW